MGMKHLEDVYHEWGDEEVQINCIQKGLNRVTG